MRREKHRSCKCDGPGNTEPDQPCESR
jgi:hypothetical protein